MKTILMGLLIFSILISSVLAIDANIYEAGDFNKNPEQIVILEERDMVRINWDNKDHQIHVRKIYLDKKKVDLTAFIEGAEVPFYVTITPKTSLQLDFDQDGEYDMKVSIFNIIEEEGRKFVALKLEKLQTDLSTVTNLDVLEKEPKHKSYDIFIENKAYLFILAFVLVLGILKRRIVLKFYKKLTKH